MTQKSHHSIPSPPFYGSKVVTDISLNQVYNYVNPVVLFRVRWKYRRQAGMTQHEYDQFIEREIRPVYERYKELCSENAWLQPLVVYGYFRAQSDGNDLIIYGDADQTEWVRFTFPRQTHTKETRCITDYFAKIDSDQMDLVAFQVVTVGAGITEAVNNFLAKGDNESSLHLSGLAVETTQALVEYTHRRFRLELDIAHEDSPYIVDFFHGSYQGTRFGFGDPACPNPEDLAKLWELLEPERIGIELSKGFEPIPKHSATAILLHHSDARPFNIR